MKRIVRVLARIWTARDSSPLSPEQFIAPVPTLLLTFFLPSLATAAPDQLAQGRILLQRLNCGACHHALGRGSPAPRLDRINERLAPSRIAEFIRHPHAIKPGTRMPRVLEESPENRREVEALTHYLLSLRPPPRNTEPLPGDPTRGRSLFHRVGCVACHQPDRTAPLPDSVPIVLGRNYHREGLVDDLLEPKTELMPSLKLSRQEASDLAAWLQRDVRPQREEPPAISKKLANAGRKLFTTRRCASCHDAPEENFPAPLPSLAIKDWTAGCLSPNPGGKAPRFELSQPQRESIRAASAQLVPVQPGELVDHILTTYRCYSCHQRNGKGGPTDERRPFFTATGQMAESYGDFGTIPPKLDHLGRKLTRDWLRKILVEGHGEVRPYLATRMPHYRIPADQVDKLIDALETADQRTPPVEIDVSGLPRHQRGHYGRDLMGTRGLNCITCHGLKGQPAVGAPVIDLSHTVQRLRPGWFKEVLLDPQSVQPGTLMPPLFLNRRKADQEVEQIWTYLKELDQRRLPDGLLRTGDFELKPAGEGRPIVFRTFLAGVGTHGIAIGNPQGTHLAFDSRTSQWALLWKGRFLDAMTTWDDRYATPAVPLAESVYPMPRDSAPPRVFRGFRLNPAGTPVFLYTENGVEVEDCIDVTLPGPLTRVVRTPKETKRHEIIIDDGVVRYRDAN